MTFSLANLFNSQAKWLEAKQNTILSAATIITITNVVSALSGLVVKRLLIQRFFGLIASEQALEAFWVAFQLPDLLFQLIVLGALSAAFIPIFTTYKDKDKKKAFYMSSIMMNVLLVVFLLASVLIFVFARPLTLLRTGSGFTSDQVEIVVRLTRIMLLSQLFFAVSNFMTGILQSFQRFIIPALAPIIYNLGILLGVFFLSNTLGIYSAGVGVVLGAFLHMAIQIPLVFKMGFKYSLSFNLKYEGIKEFFSLMPPRVLSLGASEVRKLFLGFFTTSLGNLNFLIMQLALTLMVIPIRFFGVPISQASLPFLAQEANSEDRQRFKGLVLQSLHQIAFVSLPASVLLLILRVPAVRLVFGASTFPWDKTTLTGRIVGILAISISMQAMGQLLIRAFYALKNTRTPLLISTVDLILYLLLATYFVFISKQGLYGLAITTSITAFIELSLLLFFLNKKITGLLSKAFWVPQLKMIAASFFMAVFLYLPYKILDELVFDTSRTIELIGLTMTTGTVGLLVYIYFALLFEIKELKILGHLISKFGPWQKTLAKSQEVLAETSTDNPDII